MQLVSLCNVRVSGDSFQNEVAPVSASLIVLIRLGVLAY